MPSRSSLVWNSDVVTSLRAAVAEILEGHGVDGDVPGHAVPLERLHDTLLRRHLAETALEAEVAVGAVLDVAPVSAALDLHALDVELVTAPPPLRDELGLGAGAPHALARRVEDALDADLAVGRGGHLRARRSAAALSEACS